MIRHLIVLALSLSAGFAHAQRNTWVHLPSYRMFSVLYAAESEQALVGLADPTRQVFTFAVCRVNGETGTLSSCRIDPRLWLTEASLSRLRFQFQHNLELAYVGTQIKTRPEGQAATLGFNAGLLNSMGVNSMFINLLVSAENTLRSRHRNIGTVPPRELEKLMGLLTPDRRFPLFIAASRKTLNFALVKGALYVSMAQILAR